MTFESESPAYDVDPEADQADDGMSEFWADYGLAAPATLVLGYVDSNGTETTRIVDVRLFADTPYGPELRGYCRLREAERSFSIDRIKLCVDFNSGKTIDDVSAYLYDLYKETPDYSLNTVVEHHVDTLRAALHIASCAGYSPKEQAQILLQICQKISNDARIPEDLVAPLIRAYATQATGVDQRFRLIAGRLSKALPSKTKENVLKLCQKVASLKGHSTPGCEESIAYLAKRLKEA